ncbi:MAG: hypothetical protein WAW42_09940 [Candidatus Competibacteraceae bacterium]
MQGRRATVSPTPPQENAHGLQTQAQAQAQAALNPASTPPAVGGNVISEEELTRRGQRVRNYVDQVKAGTAQHSGLRVGVIGNDAAQQMIDALGLPVDGSVEVVIADAAIHATREHPDMTGIDWEQLPRLTNQFDDVALGRPGQDRKVTRILVKKTFPNGTGYGAVLEFAKGGKRKRLNLVTYFKGRGKSLEAWWEQNKQGLDSSGVPNRTEPASKAPRFISKPGTDRIPQPAKSSSTEPADTPLLSSDTPAELKARQAADEKAAQQKAAKKKAADEKAAADRERNSFTLSGSDRPADVAMSQGQTNLLDAMDGKAPASPAPTGNLQSASYGANNTLVTADRAAELRKKLRAKFGQLNAGIDPEIVAMGTELAVFHLEAGARKFTQFVQAMANDLGLTVEALRPYLRGWYNGARDMMEDSGRDVSTMDTPDQVKAALATLTRPGEVDMFGDPVPVSHRIAKLETVEIPLDQLKLSEDVPQFKSGANAKSGVVEPLGGTFDRTGVAPIQVWKRLNGDLEVISGRHRLDLARRSGEKTLPAQIHNEADGFDAKKAGIIDAELNIRDGQGKVKDYVDYFINSKISEAEANLRGLISRFIGKTAFRIANDGSAELIASHRANALSDEAANSIALAAPGNSRLQAVAIKAVLDGKSIIQAVNTLQAVKALASEQGDSTGDMFGLDDSAMREAEQMATIASRRQRQLSERLAAVQGAAKRPELARKEGVDVKDKAALDAKITEIKREREAWESWSTSPELIAQIRDELSPGQRAPADVAPTSDIHYNLPKGTTVGGAAEISALHDAVQSDSLPANTKQAIRYGIVGPIEASRLQQATGLDLNGYKHTVDSFAIRHALNEHGKESETQRGQTPLTKEDFSRIPEIVNAPDRVERGGKDATGNDLIRYAKRYNGTTYYVEEVRTKRQELMAKTLWKTRTTITDESEKPALTLTPETFGRNPPQRNSTLPSTALEGKPPESPADRWAALSIALREDLLNRIGKPAKDVAGVAKRDWKTISVTDQKKIQKALEKPAVAEAPEPQELGNYSSEEIPADKEDAHAYRVAAQAIAKPRYANHPPVSVTIQSTQEPILVGWNGIKHVLRDGKPTWQESLAALHVEELLRGSAKTAVEPDRLGRKDPIAVHRYQTTALFDGVLHSVTLVVREHTDGKRYYDHAIVETKTPAGLPVSPAEETAPRPAPPFAGAGSSIPPTAQNTSATTAPVIATKEPWQMTRGEFELDQIEGSPEVILARKGSPWNASLVEDRIRKAAQRRHQGAVTIAVVQGQPVPAEVLADYPDLLAKRAPANDATSQTADQLRQSRKDGAMDTPTMIAGLAEKVVSGEIPPGKLFTALQAFDDWSEGDVADALRKAGLPAEQLKAMGYEDAAQSNQRFAQPASTPSTLLTNLKALSGDSLVQGLIDNGRLHLVARQNQLPPLAKIPPGQRVAGWVHPDTGAVYLIAENIAPGEIDGFLRHEVGVHQAQLGLNQPKSRALRLAHALARLVGARQILGEPSFNDALAQLQRMRAAGNTRVLAAYAKAAQAMGALNQNNALLHEEALAYLVQDHPTLPLVQRIIAAVRAFLYKAGLNINLTENDLQALAVSATKNAATRRDALLQPVTAGAMGRNSEDVDAQRQYDAVVARYTNPDGSKKAGWLKAPNGEPTKLNERQWVQVRTEAFKQWFGDWEYAAHQQAIDAIVPIKAVSLPGGSLKEINRKVLDYVDTHYLQGEPRPFENSETHDQIMVSKTALRKAMSGHTAEQKMYAATVIPELIQAAHKVFTTNDAKGRPDVKAYHYYVVPVEIDGKTYYAKLAVRELTNGHKFYDHDLSEVSEGAGQQGAMSTTVGIPPSPPSLNHIVHHGWQKFKGDASKVIDANGEPLVVYHGTDADFTAFDLKQAGKNDKGWYGKGLYFTPHNHWTFAEDSATRNGGNPHIMPVFLRIKDPAYGLARAEQGSNLVGSAADRGRDGVIIRYDGGHEQEYQVAELIVTDPTQIKSALGNTGAFSPDHPDLRFAYALGQAEADLTAEEVLRRVEAGGEVTADEFSLLQAYLSGASRALTATGLDAPTFKTWFGASKIKGKTGQPLKMYHGTAAAFTAFDANRAGSATTHPTAALGFFFTNNRQHAHEKYAGSDGNVLAVYLAVEKPYGMTDADLQRIESLEDAVAFRQTLEAQGYDGVVMPAAPGGTRYVAAFSPDQVKLTSNETFTRGEKDMRFAAANPAPGAPPQVTLPPMTRIEILRRAIQDRFLRFKTVQNWLKQKGIDLTPAADVYGAEERSVKRFAAKAEDFRHQVLRPLVQEAAKAKYAVTGGDLIGALLDGQALPATFKPSIPEYLIAQHATERNAAIARINAAYPDGGSGLTHAQAADILARYRALPDFAAFRTLAEQFRTISDGTQQMLLNEGILSADMVQAWNKAYQHYIPLKGGPDAGAQQGTGPGLSVNGRQQRAMGHGLREENVLENIFRDRERALLLVEKNQVGKALIKLLQQANNPEIGTVGEPEVRGVVAQGWMHEVWISGRPLGAFQSYNEARAAIAADSALTGRNVSQYGVRHKASDPGVMYLTPPQLADNEAAVYLDGQRVRVQLNDADLARAYNATDVDKAGGVLKVGLAFNRWLSKAYTGYNPEFLLVNVARDLTAGLINLTGQHGAGLAAQALRHYRSSLADAAESSAVAGDARNHPLAPALASSPLHWRASVLLPS